MPPNLLTQPQSPLCNLETASDSAQQVTEKTQALTSAAASTVLVVSQEVGGLHEAQRTGITQLNPKYACCNTQCSWEGYTDRMCGSVGPLCPDCGETTEPICSCPTGDGSLRWPCPVHPPETAKEVQP